jgi:NAD(P)-dependent dehydrogenase (short-subunit alcohol dehydrogenase family)
MNGEVVVVTGASAGVGRAAARALAEAGAGWVVLLARDGARLADTAAEIERRGAKALPIEVDVTDAAALERVAQRIEQQFLDEPIAPDRPDKLFHPVPTPYRAHGRFDARARGTSAQLWLSLHRGLVGTTLVGAGLAALAWKRHPARRPAA